MFEVDLECGIDCVVLEGPEVEVVSCRARQHGGVEPEFAEVDAAEDLPACGRGDR